MLTMLIVEIIKSRRWAMFPADRVAILVLALLFGRSVTGWAQSQSFNSGSNGSDGALTMTKPGTYYFDPKSFNPPLDPDGDNVYHFTTINIGSGVTVKLSSIFLNGPVYWLATGDVLIDGVIDLSGENGAVAVTLGGRTAPFAGAGGYAGGFGGTTGSAFPPQPGNGPAGGAVGGHGSSSGNVFLVPLIGGSGGGGGTNNFSGGAGGGAILIASSTSIALNGTINAYGGCGLTFGGGGHVRLVANSISGAGKIPTSQYCGANSYTVSGHVRIEAFSGGSSITTHQYAYISCSAPFGLFLPQTPPPSLRVTSIAGKPVNANPFTFPDVAINSTGPVVVNIEARYVPVGTIPKLYVFSESTSDQVIDAAPLQGTLQLSTSSATVALPAGGSRGFVKVNWTQ